MAVGTVVTFISAKIGAIQEGDWGGGEEDISKVLPRKCYGNSAENIRLEASEKRPEFFGQIP